MEILDYSGYFQAIGYFPETDSKAKLWKTTPILGTERMEVELMLT